MKALVIAPQPFFTPRGTPFSVYYRTLVTAECGVEVDLLTYGEGQDVRIPGVRIVRIPHVGFLGPVKVGPSALKAFLDALMIVWTIGLLARHRYDFVHAHEEAVFWCRFLKPIFGFRLVYDMHSRLPEQLVNFGFTRSPALIDLFARLERSALRHADAVITICPALERHVLDAGVDPGRHVLIENSLFEEVQVEPHERREPDLALAGVRRAVAEARAAGRPVVAYAGTFETYQGLDLLLRAFVRVSARCDGARLLLVGGLPGQLDQKRRLARELGIERACLFPGPLSKQEAADLLALADVLVSPRMNGINTPLKVYEQLASGRPLVATRIPAHTQVLSDDVCMLVDPDPAAMAEGILRALEDGQWRTRVARNAKALYDGSYSRPVYEAKVRRLLAILPQPR